MRTLSSRKRFLHGWKAEGEVYENLDLRNANAFQSEWTRVTFRNCNLRCANFTGARFREVVFENCDMEMCNFFTAQMQEVRFLDCPMDQASFASATLWDAYFQTCRLHVASFQNAVLKDVAFESSNLHGANLTYLEGTRISYYGSLLWGVHAEMNCTFWSGRFDGKQCQQVMAFLARIHPDEKIAGTLKEMAGDQFKVVDRLMGDEG